MITKITITALIVAFMLSLNGCGGNREGRIINVNHTIDTDHDGLTDYEENNTFHTDPYNPDTDGDGIKDGDSQEVDSDGNYTGLKSCLPHQDPGYRDYNNSNKIWQEDNCDADDYLNGTEDNVSLTPNNYLSDPYDANDACFTFGDKNSTYCEVHADDNRTWLDRSLGSKKVCESRIDSDCYGNYYQWGRGTDGHEKPNSSVDDVNPHSWPYGTPIYESATSGTYDWLTKNGNEKESGYVSERIKFWNNDDNATKYMVCPKGWRVPTIDELDKMSKIYNISDRETAFESDLKIGSAGDRTNTGGLDGQDEFAYLWSDTNTSGDHSALYSYTKNDAKESNGTYRATGASIRCIKKQTK